MCLHAIILWCLYPLAPAMRLYEATRFALQCMLATLSDPRWIGWLCANPDDPRSVAWFERWIAAYELSIDLIVFLRAREMLGLPAHTWTKPGLPRQRPRQTRTFDELFARLDRCILRFADIERLAAKRASKLKRLYEASALPRTAEEIATAARAAALTPHSAPERAGSPGPAAATTTTVSAARTRAGLRVRAPPWPTTAQCRPPLAPEARLPRPHPHAPSPPLQNPARPSRSLTPAIFRPPLTPAVSARSPQNRRFPALSAPAPPHLPTSVAVASLNATKS